jgi:hypothetical protein
MVKDISLFDEISTLELWQDSVCYLAERIESFSIDKLKIDVIKNDGFSIKVAYSFDNKNWSEPVAFADWIDLNQILLDNDTNDILRYVWISLWFNKIAPDTTTVTTMQPGFDSTIAHINIRQITYDDVVVDLNDENQLKTRQFLDVINRYPKFNFYAGQEINVHRWKETCRSSAYSYGHVVIYFRTEPKGDMYDVFASTGDRVVSSIKKIVVTPPNNELPSEKTVYSEWDMPLLDDFVVHVVDGIFKDAFGDNKIPMQKDFMFFPLLNRLFKVNNVQPSDKKVMGKIGWWECYLTKYEDDSTVSIDDDLREAMAPFPGMDDAIGEFNFNVDELEKIKGDMVIDESKIMAKTSDQKKEANSNYSNRLTDSTGYVDLKDTDKQRALYSKRLAIVSVNPDNNTFPVTMYNCQDIAPRTIGMTYDLIDATRNSKDSLLPTKSFSFNFDYITTGKFNGELFDLAPLMSIVAKRSKKISFTIPASQVTFELNYVFVDNEYYRLEFDYNVSIWQVSVRIFMLSNGVKSLKFSNVYIVRGELSTNPFGTKFSEIIMYGGSWLVGDISFEIDDKKIIFDKVNPVLKMNVMGL